jgi:Choline-glycine betaine transporter
LSSIQALALATAFPFVLIMLMMMVSLFLGLRAERVLLERGEVG